ncbi:MAG: hypothetical protein IJN19_01005 [Opitutales bacterium]|nr:hypothetical protein [Opitutales bacterium]
MCDTARERYFFLAMKFFSKIFTGTALLCVSSAMLFAGTLPKTLKSEAHSRDAYGWANRHAAVLERNKLVKPDYVFFGDSITHWWGGQPKCDVMPVVGADSWEKLFAGHVVTNCGFGFDYIDNAYYRVENGELDGIAPRVILVNLGTNNIGHRGDSSEACGDNMAAFVQLLREKSPKSKILLVGVYPRREKQLAEIIEKTNLRYAALADGEHVFFVNPGTFLLAAGSKTANPELMRDSVHLNAAGYRVIAAKIAEKLAEIDPLYTRK